MTHAMYSFLKRSASSFSSTFCFFRGGGYTTLLDSADTAICSFNISYYCCIIGIPWEHAVHLSVPIPRPEQKKNSSLGTRPVHFLLRVSSLVPRLRSQLAIDNRVVTTLLSMQLANTLAVIEGLGTRLQVSRL